MAGQARKGRLRAYRPVAAVYGGQGLRANSSGVPARRGAGCRWITQLVVSSVAPRAAGSHLRPVDVIRRRRDYPRQLIILAVTAALLAGCVLGEGRADDTSTVHNRTDAPIVVSYENIADDGLTVIELDPGEQSLLSPQLFGNNRCLPGEFVARYGDQIVDRLPQPCKEQVWDVTGP